MTLEQQVGQLLMVGFDDLSPSPEIIDLIQNYHVGGIILFSRNIQDARQVFALTHRLQEIARSAGHAFPLLIATDQENGLVRRLGTGTTIFPGNMTLGAIGSEQIVYDVALATGEELKALGINMNLAPVVDVNNNPANPVIGIRSFGEHPEAVARLAVAAVQGYRASGVVATLKHFPGHGDTATDSHLALPVISHGVERLEAIELFPFKQSIEAGAECIMTAHIALPMLMGENILPATVSPMIVRELLRERLGYDGVVISDCMEMNAITRTVGTEQGSVMTLQAGTDIALVSHTYARQRASLHAIYAAVESGALSKAAIQQSVERVLSLKQRYLSWNQPATTTAPETVESAAHTQLRDRAYALSTTLVRNEDGLIPLCPQADERIVIVVPKKKSSTLVEDRFASFEFLLESVEQYHDNAIMIPVAVDKGEEEYQSVVQATSTADIVILVTANAHLDAHQAELMRRLLQAERRVIGLAVYNPYDLLAFPSLRTYLVTYEYTPPALAAAVRVLFGDQPACGRLPVSLV